MNGRISPERLAEALTRATHHGQTSHAEEKSQPDDFTVVFSREAGTYGAAIAHEVGNRLGWPVYDRELLQRVAQDLDVQENLLEGLDERHINWLNECLNGFAGAAAVNQNTYVRYLVNTLLSLAAKGKCVIVGRGANAILPPRTTLRVRVVAPLDFRIAAVQREHGISREQAAQRVEATDRERSRFVKDYFLIDLADSGNYDLVLNAARFSIEECADLILAALERQRRHLSNSEVPALARAAEAN